MPNSCRTRQRLWCRLTLCLLHRHNRNRSDKVQSSFERFLNPERVSMPDFDVDFCKERRGEVIDYVVRKYGEDHVAQIISFGTMAARGAIRDVGRVLEIPYATVDSVAKLVPMEHDMTIGEALKLSPDLRSRCNNDPQIKNCLMLQ